MTFIFFFAHFYIIQILLGYFFSYKKKSMLNIIKNNFNMADQEADCPLSSLFLIYFLSWLVEHVGQR